MLCLIDDVLIFVQNQEEHDLRLQETLKRLQLAGVTLNAEKCAFGQRSLKFLGHIIDEQGIYFYYLFVKKKSQFSCICFATLGIYCAKKAL